MNGLRIEKIRNNRNYHLFIDYLKIKKAMMKQTLKITMILRAFVIFHTETAQA